MAEGGQARTAAESEQLRAAEGAGAPFVYFRDGAGRQQVQALPESGGALSIGRGPWMDISLPWDDQVSRLHAQLECVGDEWTILDEGLSSNGSFLNGIQVTGRRRIGDGDQLRFGSTVVTLRIPSDRLDQATQVRSRPEQL